MTNQKTQWHRISKGLLVKPSMYYRGRYCCSFYGGLGIVIKNWIRDQFGTDDMVYADETTSGEEFCEALISEEQMVLTKLRWSD